MGSVLGKPGAVRSATAIIVTIAMVFGVTVWIGPSAFADAETDRAAPKRGAPPRVIAHRGASAAAPENTMPAMRRAVRRGADWLEMDVQQTKDGRLVLFHDWSLRRTTNVEKVFPKLTSPSVGDLRYKRLRKLDAGRWKAKKWRGTKIPTLKRALKFGKKNNVKMLVELKNPGRYRGIVKKTLRVLRRQRLMKRGHKDRAVLQSFRIRAMRRAARRSKLVDIGLLYSKAPKKLRNKKWAQYVNPKHTTVNLRFIRRAHKRNIKIFVWTVNGRRKIRRAKRMNVNGIITDKPRKVRKAVH